MMPVSSNQGAGCDIVTVIGVDRSIALTVTENAVARPWASDTFTALIYEKDGSTAAAVTTWTFTTGADGAATLSLTAAQLTTLGVGTFRYALINVTQDQPWFEGQLSVVGPTSSGTATTGITLALTTGGGITLDISVVATTAAQVTVADAGGWFTGADVETVLQEFAARAFPVGTPTSGQYFRMDGSAGTLTLVANRVTYAYVDIAKAFTMDRIGCVVTTLGAGSTIRLGLYQSGANGFPGALILDAGTVDSSGTGTLEITISQAVPAGRLWLAAVQQGGTPPQARTISGQSRHALGFLETFTAGVGPTTIANLAQFVKGAIYENGVSGALPPTATPGFDNNSFTMTTNVFGRAA